MNLSIAPRFFLLHAMALLPFFQVFVLREELALQMTIASVTKGGEDILVKGSVQTATSTTS